jgi:hypothetical protein
MDQSSHHHSTADVAQEARPSFRWTNKSKKSEKTTTRTMTSCLRKDKAASPPRPPSAKEILDETLVIPHTISSTSINTNKNCLSRDDNNDSQNVIRLFEDDAVSDCDSDTVESATLYHSDHFFRRKRRNTKATSDSDGVAAPASFDPEEANEVRKILAVRILFSILLILSTVGIACAVFFYVEATETREFENQSRSDADKLKESIGLALRSTLASADALAINYLAVQKAGNTSFPFVVLPSFAVQAAKLKIMARAYAIGVNYIVTDEQRSDWELFASTHGPSYVEEAWTLQAQDRAFQGSLEQYPIIRDELFTNFPELAIVPQGSGPYLVGWQSYPIVYSPISGPYNYHILSFPTLQRSFNGTLSTKRPVLSGFSLVDPLSDVAKVSLQYLSNFVAKGESAAEPVTNLVYPILSQDLLDLSLDDKAVDNAALVGIISIGFFWRELLRDILPETSEGIDIVTKEVCESEDGAIFTYEINGAQTTYLGPGDWSDPAYHHLQSSFNMVELMDTATLSPGQRYTGVPLMETGCSINMKIYPSSKTKDAIYGSKPIVFTISSVMVFLFAGILFAVYDLLVKRRQRKVAKIAARSSAIVSDLFPKELQSRLYESQDESAQYQSKKGKHVTWTTTTTQDRGSSSLESLAGSDERHDGQSIADVYSCK